MAFVYAITIGIVMAQVGQPPDCVHCQFMVRLQSGEYRCRQHDITLHTPVSLLCKNITPKSDDDETYLEWFEKAIDTEELESNTLYTWTTIPVHKQGIVEVMVDVETIAPMLTYINWSAGIFWQMLREVRINRREHYRKRGYQVSE